MVLALPCLQMLGLGGEDIALRNTLRKRHSLSGTAAAVMKMQLASKQLSKNLKEEVKEGGDAVEHIQQLLEGEKQQQQQQQKQKLTLGGWAKALLLRKERAAKVSNEMRVRPHLQYPQQIWLMQCHDRSLLMMRKWGDAPAPAATVSSTANAGGGDEGEHHSCSQASTHEAGWEDVEDPFYDSEEDMEMSLATGSQQGTEVAYVAGKEAGQLGQARPMGNGSRWDAKGLGFHMAKQGANGMNKAAGEVPRAHVWRPLIDPREMDHYTCAVAPSPSRSTKPTPHTITRHKLRYLKQEIVGDLHPHSWRELDFWLELLLVLIAFWMRMYLHFLGQWGLLRAEGVTVYGYVTKLHVVQLRYITSATKCLHLQVGIVAWGPTFLLLVFAVGVFAAWVLQRLVTRIPEWASRFIAAFGMATVLDPWLVMLVDLIDGNYYCHRHCESITSLECACHEGDAWKLYAYLEKAESAGVTGVFITAMLYTAVSITAAMLLYTYLLHVHMNGRMLDAWRRLNGDEEDFFVPQDMELSMKELEYNCNRCRNWYGAGGMRRDVVTCEYEMVDPLRPAKREITTHVAIYQQGMSGNRVLHRHFLVSPNGSIVEMFGDLGKTVGAQFKALQTLLLRTEESSHDVTGSNLLDTGIFAGIAKG
ncbi:unnamed protein product [Chrysoparadoxa australica]